MGPFFTDAPVSVILVCALVGSLPIFVDYNYTVHMAALGSTLAILNYLHQLKCTRGHLGESGAPEGRPPSLQTGEFTDTPVLVIVVCTLSLSILVDYDYVVDIGAQSWHMAK